MTKAKKVLLAYTLLSTTFAGLCINTAIFGLTRSPLSIAGIALSALATIISALALLISRRI